MKRTLSIALLILIFISLLALPIASIAAEQNENTDSILSEKGFQDPYEAYGITSEDKRLYSVMTDNRPEAIAIKPYKIRWKSFEFDLSNSVGTLILEKGEESSFKIAVKKTSESGTETLEIISNVTLGYHKNDPSYLFYIEHDTSLDYKTTFSDGEPQHSLSETSKNWCNMGAGIEGDKPGFFLFLCKSEDDKPDDTSMIKARNHGELFFEYVGVKLNNQKGTIVVDTEASSSGGETDVSVAAIIVVGAAGLIAAAAGIGAASGGETQEDGEQQSTYKMYIYKEFGDSIRYDKPAVIVYARMAEITPEGVEKERLDLTNQINIYSTNNHMRVGTPTIAGNYVGATVEAESIKGGPNPSHGVVSFSFTGEGGSFQNNVSFKLVGEPYIKFDNQGEYLFMEVNMILGDKGQYAVPFTLHDFTEIPEVTVKPQEDSPFEVELEKTSDFKYKALINNTSTTPETVETKRTIYNVEVTAETENETQTEAFRTMLYPEGLSVSIIEFDKEGYAQIRAYEDKEAAEGQEEVLATRFKVELVVSEKDQEGNTKAQFVELSNVALDIDKIKGTDEKTNNVAKAFKYEIEETSTPGTYRFQPKMQIPEGDSKLYFSLPMSCSYNNQQYNLDLPVRLIGEPFNEMKAKQEELDLLLKRVKRYMPPEDWTNVIRNIKENYDRLSSKEIRLLNRSLYETTANKLLREAQAEIDFANTLDWVVWGLEWVQWIGDQAFAYLMLTYTGPIGEALIVPAKDIMVDIIAEDIWYSGGITSDMEKFQAVSSNVMAMIENSLMSQIDSKTSVKKAGFILAGFMVIKTLNHYFTDAGPDGKAMGFYDAILAGFSDLTENACKFIISEKFDDLLKSPKAKAYFNKYATDWVKSFLDKTFAGWQDKGADIISKYIQELCGLGVANVYSKATQTEIDVDGGFVITFNLWEDAENSENSIIVSLDIMKVKDKFFEYVFAQTFNIFPFAPGSIDLPKDPTFITKA